MTNKVTLKQLIDNIQAVAPEFPVYKPNLTAPYDSTFAFSCPPPEQTWTININIYYHDEEKYENCGGYIP